MNKHFRTICAGLAVLTGLLAGCGGGGGATTAAAAGGSNAGLEAMGSSLITAAGVTLNGLDGGFYGLLKGTASPLSQFEAPQASPGGRHPTPTCSTGTLNTSTTGNDTSIRYNNGVIEGSTLNGTITVQGPIAFTAGGVWTSTFSGFTVNTTDDSGAAVRLAYSGSQVFQSITWSGTTTTAYATGGKATLVDVVVDINNGAGNMTFTNLLLDFTYTDSPERTTVRMSGGFGYTLKLADFGITVPAGVPSTVAVNFTASTPEQLVFTATSESGRLILDSQLYKMEFNFTAGTCSITVNGVPTSFGLGA
ncbi:MAG: hypothetical protein ACKO1L_03430 [Brachymonas sp.]